MQFHLKSHLAIVLGLLAGWPLQSQASQHPPAPAQSRAAEQSGARPARSKAARQLVVEKISIRGENPFQLQVQTTSGVTVQTQVVTGPERLIIDVPGATPGRALRNQTVNGSQVERVRVALLSAVPRVTRIVLDLNSPPAYNIQTSSSGFTVTLAANAPSVSKPPIEAGQVIGWVTTKSAAISAAPHDPLLVGNQEPPPPPVNPSDVRVVGGKGQLEIHARNATLSEVLFQVEKQTGAEIAIPAGTEQQRVIGDFGPGTASEVLAELLNGSDLNFVVVGSPNNPYTLRSVILTHKGPGFAEYVPRENAAPAANNAPPDNSLLQPGGVQPPPVAENTTSPPEGQPPPDNSALQAGSQPVPENQQEPEENAAQNSRFQQPPQVPQPPGYTPAVAPEQGQGPSVD